MGTWGTEVLQDDVVADVIGFTIGLLKKGSTIDEATSRALSNFSELRKDADDGPLLWLAIAELQWRYGRVDPDVLNHVRSDIENENGLEPWRDDPKALSSRKKVLVRFLARIEQPNPNPRALPKPVVRRAPFQKGDCLSVHLPDSQYTACLVLGEDNSDPELGMNLVAGLDYYESVPPDTAVFTRRDWLKKTFGCWDGRLDICWYLPIGLRSIRKQITVVDNIKIKWSDPKKSGTYTRWDQVGSSVVYSRAASEDND